MAKTASRKWYVVWAGRCPGIYQNWASCQSQTDGFPGARFKSFTSQAEAEAAFGANSAASTSARQATTRATTTPIKSVLTTQSKLQIRKVEADVKIFVDGACNPNPGEAGSGAAVYEHGVLTSLWYGRYQPQGTNNTAELAALHYGLVLAGEATKKGHSAAVFADSSYAINCITQWAAGWEKKGWTRKHGDIQNLEQIQEIYAVYLQIKDKVEVHHVNGHIGIEGNELADRMSLLAVDELQAGWCRHPEPIIIDDVLAMRADSTKDKSHKPRCSTKASSPS
ncbi:ribonuclease H family protein [Pseudomonas asiatica]|uniref:ribonuclease H family protein n=1 Tax=Pseudomonas asiatica TaxID=2219225 RepID=UPI0025A0435D|nr:ribonuclease H family protein [Pseudomonas asiatica]WJM54471.1 ribonuclease H family protein [Pseudomonas asiatica]